jgi:hypothetical protein
MLLQNSKAVVRDTQNDILMPRKAAPDCAREDCSPTATTLGGPGGLSALGEGFGAGLATTWQRDMTSDGSAAPSRRN